TEDLRGLRVSLVGFQDCSSESFRGGLLGNPLSEKENMTSICRDWLGLQVIQPSNDQSISPDIALCDESSLDEAILLTQANKSIPVVVVCQNAVVARRLAAINAQKQTTSERWIHFTYQPLGPRKLAGTLSRTLEHWMSRQSLPEDQAPHRKNIKDKFFPLGRDAPITPPVVKEEKIFPFRNALIQDSHIIPNLRLPQRVLQSPALEKDDPFVPGAERRGDVFLLVDDNPINLKMLSTFMKKLGYQYDTATDGQQAVISYQQQPERYKCVFMDISMPVMNGFEATRLIRTMEAEPSLPRCTIMALTGLASHESQQEAFMCGIDLFLTKPVKLAEIKQILEAKHLT
ncbi:ATPase-like ATP-binding domain, partial [Fusarium albosuccineum]